MAEPRSGTRLVIGGGAALLVLVAGLSAWIWLRPFHDVVFVELVYEQTPDATSEAPDGPPTAGYRWDTERRELHPLRAGPIPVQSRLAVGLRARVGGSPELRALRLVPAAPVAWNTAEGGVFDVPDPGGRTPVAIELVEADIAERVCVVRVGGNTSKVRFGETAVVLERKARGVTQARVGVRCHGTVSLRRR